MKLGLALDLTDREAEILHHAIATVVTLIDGVAEQGGVAADAPLADPARDELVVVARRLDHERRHHGAVQNPNTPEGAQ